MFYLDFPQGKISDSRVSGAGGGDNSFLCRTPTMEPSCPWEGGSSLGFLSLPLPVWYHH